VKRSFLLSVILASVMLVSCGNPYSSSYTRAKPREADLYGTWIPDTSTLKDLRDRGRYNLDKGIPKLVLQSNGQFEMTNMPDWWRDSFGRSNMRLESDRGSWEIHENGPGTWGLSLDSSKFGINQMIFLRKQSPPYLIHFTIGDPDEGEAMVFVRTANGD